MSKRDIKFRGKRVEDGKWIYGDLYHTCELTCICDWSIRPHTVEEFEVIPSTLGQFTGLYDKGGKEIFEGDILSANGQVVGWVKGNVRGYCYDVVYINHPAGEERWPLYATVVKDYGGNIEITGNIHDNPGMLEGGER